MEQNEDDHERGYLLEELNKVLQELDARTNSEERALEKVAELKLERDQLLEQVRSLKEEKDIFLQQFNKVLQDHGKMLDEQTHLRSMASIAEEKMSQVEHIFTENEQLKKINAEIVEESAHWKQFCERTIDKMTMMQEEKQDILMELSGVLQNHMLLRIGYDDIKAKLTEYEKVLTVDQVINEMLVRGSSDGLRFVKTFEQRLELLHGALETNVHDVIITVVLFIKEKFSRELFEEHCLKNPEVVDNLATYYKRRKELMKLKRLLRRTGRFHELGKIYFDEAHQEIDEDSKLSKLERCLTYFKEHRSLEPYIALVNEYIDHIIINKKLIPLSNHHDGD